MAETAIKKEKSSPSSDFSLNGLLVGYLVFGLLIIGAAIFIGSIPSVMSDIKKMLGVTRGMVLFISFLIGLVATTPFALYFEKKSR